MIEIYVPNNVPYDELVIRTITNITIKQLCFISEELEDVKQAYDLVKRPCIALDTDFRIDELNGFPRAFVNFSLDTIGIDGILKLMEGKKNRKCAFNECLAYYDGKEIHYFYGKHPRKFIRKSTGTR